MFMAAAQVDIPAAETAECKWRPGLTVNRATPLGSDQRPGGCAAHAVDHGAGLCEWPVWKLPPA
jgi:hypothetical protein